MHACIRTNARTHTHTQVPPRVSGARGQDGARDGGDPGERCDAACVRCARAARGADAAGRRRGLGIGGLADPLYVVELDVDKKHVIVGPKEFLKTRIVPVAEVNWLGDEPLTSRDEWQLSVKVRSTRPPREAILRPINEKRAEVELLNPEEGVSPGQACVFYDTHGSRIYGGGWITKRA